jgi:predicted N-formylglutamate amidohydrolase
VALQNYSRLVIDCNRRLDRPDSIPVASEDTPIPGNVGLSREAAHQRAAEIFEPYHARINEELDARARGGRKTVVVLVHSFTPSYRGGARPWHAGVLHHKDTRFAFPVLSALREEPDLVVGDNEPYAASALTDYGIVEHAERRGLLHVELEVRQDLIETPSGQAAWSDRLSRILSGALKAVAT